MEKEIENIIRNNEFSELSTEDKLVLQDWVSSEDEFDVLKQILTTAAAWNEEVAPSPKLLASLTDSFNTHYAAVTGSASTAGSGNTKGFWMRIAISAAAIFVLFMLLFPFNIDDQKETFTAENEKQTTKLRTKELKENTIDSSEKEKTKPIKINRQLPIDGVQESQNQLAVVEQYKQSAAIEASPEYFGVMRIQMEALSSMQFNRLDMSDLSRQNRQVIQDNPALLDLLYTAF